MYNIISKKEHQELEEADFKILEARKSRFVSLEQSYKKNSLSYFIGLEWIIPNEKALCVVPKIDGDDNSNQTNYLLMLMNGWKYEQSSDFLNQLFEIKLDEPPIEVEQKQDLLTPFLVIQFLQVVKTIVRKGLKKSYYKIERNLNAKVKGKVLIAQNLKQNIFKNKPLNTVCQYEEFGFNNIENRFLKKVLRFVQRYLSSLHFQKMKKDVQNVFNYILPAFEMVDDTADMNELKQLKTNAFYKEYSDALRLGKLILKRFGYNLAAVNEQTEKIKVPPFCIDMSKLFELHVLGLLKERFGDAIQFQVKGNSGIADYILTKAGEKMIIDAKYRPLYHNTYDIDNIRQLSGYARDKLLLEQLGVEETKIVDLLIIYPHQTEGVTDFKNDFKLTAIDKFIQFHKIGIKLPMLKIEQK
jgi:5-methylcytosine-specific restriction enzyme subunit McrC